MEDMIKIQFLQSKLKHLDRLHKEELREVENKLRNKVTVMALTALDTIQKELLRDFNSLTDQYEELGRHCQQQDKLISHLRRECVKM